MLRSSSDIKADIRKNRFEMEVRERVLTQELQDSCPHGRITFCDGKYTRIILEGIKVSLPHRECQRCGMREDGLVDLWSLFGDRFDSLSGFTQPIPDRAARYMVLKGEATENKRANAKL